MILAIFGSIGPAEIIIIVLIAVVLFGRRLPEVGRTVGKTLFQVRRGLNDIKGDFYEQTADIRQEIKETERDLNEVLNEPPKPAPLPEPPKSAAEETEKPETEETDGESVALPDLEAEKAVAETEEKKKDSAEDSGT